MRLSTPKKLSLLIAILLIVVVSLKLMPIASAQFYIETRADINQDGQVNIFDFNEFVTDFGKGSGIPTTDPTQNQYHLVSHEDHIVMRFEEGYGSRSGIWLDLFQNGTELDLNSQNFMVTHAPEDSALLTVVSDQNTPNSGYSIDAKSPGSTSVITMVKSAQNLNLLAIKRLPVTIYDSSKFSCADDGPINVNFVTGEDAQIPIGQIGINVNTVNNKFVGYQYDFDGDGFYDTHITENNIMPFKFLSPGSYLPRYRIVGSNNLFQDCEYPTRLTVTGEVIEPDDLTSEMYPVDWSVDNIHFTAQSFIITANGRVYKPPQDTQLIQYTDTSNGIPSGLVLALRWNDNDEEIRLNIIFKIDQDSWEYDSMQFEDARYFSWIEFQMPSTVPRLTSDFQSNHLFPNSISMHSDPEVWKMKKGHIAIKQARVSITKPDGL